MEGDSISFITESNKKICEITKRYSDSGFPEDESSIGYPIDVFQETINKTFREYLVNFQYLIRSLENYGFVLINNEEAHQLGLPNSSGLFNELFAMMENEIKQNPKRKFDYKDAFKMSNAEKSLSFINRYFVFKKMISVRANEIEKQFLNKSSWDLKEDDELIGLNREVENVMKQQPAFTGKIKKLRVKIILNKEISMEETKDENEDFLNIEQEQEQEEKQEQPMLEETELPFPTEEETIVLKPKVVLSDKKITIKKPIKK
jgi:hypothetical protein